jgi:Uma2 family endonuclease
MSVTARRIHYPDSDGKPMGETPRHVKVLLQAYGLLDLHFEPVENVFVACNMFLYYAEGNPRKHVSPDLFLVRGIRKRRRPERRNYKIWDEGGKEPDWILEVTSDSTREEDLETKFFLYQDVLRVREYFLFDPYADYLSPALQGYRLEAGLYMPIVPIEGRWQSEVLGLALEEVGSDLRFFDPQAGQHLKTLAELAAENEQLKRSLRKKRGKAKE